MASKKRFVDSMDDLIRKMPKQGVAGSVVVDQIYAHYQHEGLDFKHPDGGEAEYLRRPLYTKHVQYMRRLAKSAVTRDGNDLLDAMKENVEDLSLEVFKRAPLEFGDLKGSGQPMVLWDGKKRYHRPPNVHRLTEIELKDKSKLRYLFDPHRYKGV